MSVPGQVGGAAGAYQLLDLGWSPSAPAILPPWVHAYLEHSGWKLWQGQVREGCSWSLKQEEIVNLWSLEHNFYHLSAAGPGLKWPSSLAQSLIRGTGHTKPTRGGTSAVGRAESVHIPTQAASNSGHHRTLTKEDLHKLRLDNFRPICKKSLNQLFPWCYQILVKVNISKSHMHYVQQFLWYLFWNTPVEG